MFCSNCGENIGKVNFCSNCGSSQKLEIQNEESSPDLETLRIRAKAKFPAYKNSELSVVGGDFKLGKWSMMDGKLTPILSFKGPRLSSETVDRIEVLKDGLSISGNTTAGAGAMAGFVLGGVWGALAGDGLGSAMKRGGTLIKIFFNDGKTMIAVADGDTMSAIYGASL